MFISYGLLRNSTCGHVVAITISGKIATFCMEESPPKKVEVVKWTNNFGLD
jgi:hypothetical protein